MDKWDKWWDSLSPTTQAYLKTRPLWHDNDLAKAFAFGALIGFFIGWVF